MFIDYQYPILRDEFDICPQFLVDVEQAIKSGKKFVISLDATHGGYANRNWFYYELSSMRDSVDTWIKPFRKPVLINHDVFSDPLGRVHDSKYIGNKDEGFIRLKAVITDMAAVEKVVDERYLTVSTAGLPIEHVTCSVCSKNFLDTMRPCGHVRGKSYENDDGENIKCFWKMGRLQYSEVSFVNKPADQTDEYAAGITGWKFEDSQALSNPDGVLIHDAVIDIDESLEEVKTSVVVQGNKKEKNMEPKEPYSKQNISDYVTLLESGVDIVADPKIMRNLRTKDKGKLIKRYIDKGGTFKVDVADIKSIDITLTDDDVKSMSYIEDVLFGMKRYIAEYDKDDKKSKKHRHVLYVNEVGNGYSDWSLSHSHEVVDLNVLPSRKYDPVGEKYIDGHTHKLGEEIEFDFGDSIEGTPEILILRHEDEDKPSVLFPVMYKSQIADAISLLSTYAGPGDVSKIKTCLKRQAKDMDVEDFDRLEQICDLVSNIVQLA